MSRCRKTTEEANAIIQIGDNSSLVALIAVEVLKVVQFWICFADRKQARKQQLELDVEQQTGSK